MSRSSMNYLAFAIAFTLAMVTIGVFALNYASRELKAARALHTQAALTAQQFRQRYLEAARDEPAIRETITRFESLRATGVIGAERRLDWADRMRHIARTRGIPKLEFDLLPQRATRKLDAEGEYILAASNMRIRAGLLHEGDLLWLLSDLQATRNALVVPRSCAMDRAPASGTQEALTLTAVCEVDWVTVQPRNALPAALRK